MITAFLGSACFGYIALATPHVCKNITKNGPKAKPDNYHIPVMLACAPFAFTFFKIIQMAEKCSLKDGTTKTIEDLTQSHLIHIIFSTGILSGITSLDLARYGFKKWYSIRKKPETQDLPQQINQS